MSFHPRPEWARSVRSIEHAILRVELRLDELAKYLEWANLAARDRSPKGLRRDVLVQAMARRVRLAENLRRHLFEARAIAMQADRREGIR